MTSLLIPCVLRHLDEADGMRMLDEVLEHPELVVGIGLDSSEVGHPHQSSRGFFVGFGMLV